MRGSACAALLASATAGLRRGRTRQLGNQLVAVPGQWSREPWQRRREAAAAALVGTEGTAPSPSVHRAAATSRISTGNAASPQKQRCRPTLTAAARESAAGRHADEH